VRVLYFSEVAQGFNALDSDIDRALEGMIRGKTEAVLSETHHGQSDANHLEGSRDFYFDCLFNLVRLICRLGRR
jgi:hypothetical protein